MGTRDRLLKRTAPGPVGKRNPVKPQIPTNFVTVETISAKLAKLSIDISPARLEELAESGHLPHWRFCMGGKETALYRLGDVKAWVLENSLKEVPGAPFPPVLEVLDREQAGLPAKQEEVPESIRSFWSSLRVASSAVVPGVYFLVREGRVVYVGQSINVHGRTNSHARERKRQQEINGIGGYVFDFALFLPVPRSDLMPVEAAFIRSLVPEYNGKVRSGIRPEDAEWLRAYDPGLTEGRPGSNHGPCR
tara:strand:+ start:380 stop:1126 length:747 start_codon:yes stop_codon:yes gene_type:complete